MSNARRMIWVRAIVLVTVCAARALAQVATAQYDEARSGGNTTERLLSPRTVGPVTFGRSHVIRVDGDVYAQVLFLPRVAVRGKGVHPVIFVATEHNSVFAFDASSPAEPLWQVDLSGVVRGATPVPMRDSRCGFIRPEVGITATPVIDTVTRTLYVLARTREPQGFVQRLHAIDLESGAVRRSAIVNATVAGNGAGSVGGTVRFDPLRENARAGLLLSHGVLVIAWASSCDVGPFHGWIMAFDAATLGRRAALNVTPDGHGGGIWQGDAALAADSAGDIYAVTGDGTFDAGAGGRDYGDAVLRLRLRDTVLVVRDYFAPYDQKRLDAHDADLGSGGPLLFPSGTRPGARLLFVGGKGGEAYLLDRDHLGGFDAQANRSTLQTIQSPGMIMGASAYWNGHVFTVWSNDVVRDYALQHGRLSPIPIARGTHVFTDPGATPTVSANGTTDAIVWVIETRTWNGRDRPAVLHAYDAADVKRELYSSEWNARRDRAGIAVRFATPTVAAGRVYVGTKGEVDVYELLTSQP